MDGIAHENDTEGFEEDQESSLREDMEAAIAEVENGFDGDGNADGGTPAEQSSVDDDKSTEEASEDKERESGAESKATESEQDSEDKDNSSVDDTKAPSSWSPAARESWEALPDNVKAQVSKRERETMQVLQDSAAARKVTDTFRETVAPYQQIMAMEGITDPMQAVQGLFQTVATLRMGTSHDKAAAIAKMIGTYDVDIGALDDYLVGQTPPDTEDSRLNSLLDERLKPVNDLMSRLNTDQQNNEAKEAAKHVDAVAEFGKTAEFLPDVRMDMADLIDMASKRGADMTLQEAYDKACALHPEIAGVLAKRKADDALLNGRSILDKKRRAASSISGRAGGVTVANPSGRSMREDISDAWGGE